MRKKYTFHVPGCGECPHHQRVGSILNETRYCAGFKRRKPKRFRKSDPVSNAPKWCPRRIYPPICRVHGFKDERSEHMNLMWRTEYNAGRVKDISPAPFHYVPRTEIPLGMTARQFFDALQENPLRDVLPEEVCDGEIIEIDDGLVLCLFNVDFGIVAVWCFDDTNASSSTGHPNCVVVTTVYPLSTAKAIKSNPSETTC